MWLRSIEVQFLLATMTANPLRGILHQDVCLLVGLGGAEVMNISGVALRLADHDYANRGRSVGFLTWIHGAKVHIFGLATPKDTRKIPQNPCKTVGAIMWHGKVMKSGGSAATEAVVAAVGVDAAESENDCNFLTSSMRHPNVKVPPVPPQRGGVWPCGHRSGTWSWYRNSCCLACVPLVW